MAIINISRQPYSFRNEIAVEIADRLDYRLIDKSLINNKVKDFHYNFSDELHHLANEKKPGFFKDFFKTPQLYNCLVQSIILKEASHDNVVVNGRGGQYILNQPYVLNIRVVAPFDRRCSYLEKKEGVNHGIAEKRLKKKDHERENFIRYLFKKDISEPSPYDLIFKHHKLDTEIIIATILSFVEKIEKVHPMTDHDKDALKRLSLEKKVEAIIKKEMPEYEFLEDIECGKLGDIKITGSYTDGTTKDKIYSLVQSCQGVNSVNMQMIRFNPWVG